MDTPSAEQTAVTSTTDGASAPATAGATADKILEATAPSKVEVAKEPPKVEPPKPKISPELAALAKRERGLTTAEKALKDREAKAAEIEGKFAPLAEAIEKKDLRRIIKLTGAPLADVIEALSTMEDEPTEAVLTPQQVARAEAEKLLQERDDAARAASEQAFTERYERAKSTKIEELKRLAASDTDRFERISVDDTVDAASEAWDLIEQWHAETGEVLKLDAALDHVESKLLERHKRIAAGKKLGTTATPPKKPSTEAASATTDGKAATPTISNRDGGRSVADSDEESNDIAGLPDSKRVERAMRRAGIAA